MAPKETANNETTEKPVQINKWDCSAVKNAVDDAVKDVLIKKFGYTENYHLIDIRLVICTVAVLIALYALGWDYFQPFPKSRPVLIICVVLYFLMMGVLSLYTTCKEKGIFTVVQKDGANGQRLYFEVSSYMKKFDDMYTLQMDVYGLKRTAVQSQTLEKSVSNFIDVNGCIVNEAITNEVSRMHNSLMNGADKKDK